MSRIDISARELFLKLATTPRARSAKADKVFRRLRAEETAEIVDALARAPTKLHLGAPKLAARTR
jgi:hypothetical protein